MTQNTSICSNDGGHGPWGLPRHRLTCEKFFKMENQESVILLSEAEVFSSHHADGGNMRR